MSLKTLITGFDIFLCDCNSLGLKLSRFIMSQINLKKLQAHRTRTFNLPPSKRVVSVSQALTFIDKRGFVYFWPIKGIDLPSLWASVAGDRPVAHQHDDPGQSTCGCNDDALDKKRWYYAKILRG